MRTPKAEYRLIGDGLQISANKSLLVWSKKSQQPVLAVVRDGVGDDPRGQLWTEDCTRQLDWADFCHYCYVGCPKESSADKELAVFARRPGSPWVKAWTGEPHETNAADAVADALRLTGHEVEQRRTGHPPRE